MDLTCKKSYLLWQNIYSSQTEREREMHIYAYIYIYTYIYVHYARHTTV
jgi:hypothetical protein